MWSWLDKWDGRDKPAWHWKGTSLFDAQLHSFYLKTRLVIRNNGPNYESWLPAWRCESAAPPPSLYHARKKPQFHSEQIKHFLSKLWTVFSLIKRGGGASFANCHLTRNHTLLCQDKWSCKQLHCKSNYFPFSINLGAGLMGLIAAVSVWSCLSLWQGSGHLWLGTFAWLHSGQNPWECFNQPQVSLLQHPLKTNVFPFWSCLSSFVELKTAYIEGKVGFSRVPSSSNTAQPPKPV